MRIDASTKCVALLGRPVDHSRSPHMHNAAFQVQGLNIVYLAFEVGEGHLAAAVEGLRGLGFLGANVTIPYKEEVLALLDEVHDRARMVGAVNTLVNRSGRLIGDNTDMPGFLAALRRVSPAAPNGMRALLLGSGGAGRAVAAALALEGAAELLLYDTDASRAEALREAVRMWAPDLRCSVIAQEALTNAAADADLLVNATPVGMGNRFKLSPVPVDTLSARQTVFDLAYGAETTALVREAQRRGAKTVDGIDMLVEQAAYSYAMWTGRKPPMDMMRRDARAL